jgi:LPS-assembly lipoprotein
MRAAKLSVILLLAGLLAACGFKLRGSTDLPAHKLPFATIALTLAPHLGVLRPAQAQHRGVVGRHPGGRCRRGEAILAVLGDTSQKNILSLNTSGRVREFQLVRTFSFKVQANNPAAAPAPQVKYTDAPAVAPTEYVPASTIVLRREVTYSDDLVLSKEGEEALLWRDIQNDLVQQLMRRLATAKLQPVKQD